MQASLRDVAVFFLPRQDHRFGVFFAIEDPVRADARVLLHQCTQATQGVSWRGARVLMPRCYNTSGTAV